MELVYKKAGHIELLRYRDSKRFLFTGIVQSLVPSITPKSTTLADGNSDWDYDYSAGKDGQVAINLNSFVPRLYAALVASEYKDESNLAIRRIEEISVPAASPYTVKLKKAPEASTVVIVNEDDSPFVSGSPTANQGEYKVSGDLVEFNSADAGTYLMVAYDYKATTGKQFEMDEQTNDDIFQVTIAGEACRKDNESIVIADSMTFDRMKATGELAMPPRQKEPAGWNFTMKVLKPRPGYKVIDYRTEVPSN
jgi:hypothetical protein